nr:unnamed protein product [Callosobruchus chinensis]
MCDFPRVLSIQSHVVSGYVGNKSAVFPMQLLGLEVDFINSVQFCTHTGYKKVTGQVLTEKDLSELMDGLIENEIDSYSYLLTGYIGAASFLQEIIKVVKHLKTKNPKLVYVCDPVIGDNGKIYVPKELIPIYKEFIIPLATIMTPNLFEAELLSDIKIKNPDDVWDACKILHSKGCQTVVISSAEFENIPGLHIFASNMKGKDTQRYTLVVDKLPIAFIGTGDMFASLLLSWMHKTNGDIKLSLERTVATLQAVLKRTASSIKGCTPTSRQKELRLVQSKQDIENPQVTIEAKAVQ